MHDNDAGAVANRGLPARMMPGESEDALNSPNPTVPWRPMEIKERFAALHFDSNIPRQIYGWLNEWLAG